MPPYLLKGKVPRFLPTWPPSPLSPCPRGKPQATLSPLVARWILHQAAAGLGALLHSQPAHGKTEAAKGGRAPRSAEISYLQSGQDLLVGQGSPVGRAQGFQAQFLGTRHQHHQKLGFVQRSAIGRVGKPLLEPEDTPSSKSYWGESCWGPLGFRAAWEREERGREEGARADAQA